MSIFAEAVETLFTDPNIGRDATWRAGGIGVGATVRIVFRAPDQVASFDSGRFVTVGRFVDVRISEVPTLQPGDTFTFGSVNYAVQGEPTRDDDSLIWSAEVRAA